MKLFMLILGATPPGRLIEQHDVFFGVGRNLADLIAGIDAFWPESRQKWHVDAWREVTRVGGFAVTVAPSQALHAEKLFFINLGGYRAESFQEFHEPLLVAATSQGAAVQAAKRSAFYQNYHLAGAGASHVDNKFGVVVDDIYRVDELLDAAHALQLKPAMDDIQDIWHLGYTPRSQLEKHYA